ncbi:MAG: hypothetical protein AAFX93_18375 [Verrucomicrobiota bacterium]
MKHILFFFAVLLASVGLVADSNRELATLADDETLSLDYSNASIRQILREASIAYDVNVFIPEELSSERSLRLKNVTLPQLFDILLNDSGYFWYREGNEIHVRPESEIQDTYTEERIFFNSLRFEDVAVLLDKLEQDGLILSVDFDRTANSLQIKVQSVYSRQLHHFLTKMDEMKIGFCPVGDKR